MSMKEKLARASFNDSNTRYGSGRIYDPHKDTFRPGTWDEQDPLYQKIYYDRVLAILQALREPSEEMIKAIERQISRHGHLTRGGALFEVAIDTIINEGTNVSK